MSIKSFLDYKRLLQENYIEYKYIFLPLLKLVTKILCRVYCYVTVAYVCTARGFLVVNVCNQGKTLCSPCIIYIDCPGEKVHIQDYQLFIFEG